MQGDRAPLIRQATEADAAELARLRWDFSPEEVAASGQSFDQFREGFREFLVSALAGGNWCVWVAEQAGRLVANVWVQVIHPVPRPGRFGRRYGYITNVYSEPEVRGQGIGSCLLKCAIDWARDQRVAFLFLWPSEESVSFYQRAGFRHSPDTLERYLDL
jgi:GNAT superfamily N-acetyltransferase